MASGRAHPARTCAPSRCCSDIVPSEIRARSVSFFAYAGLASVSTACSAAVYWMWQSIYQLLRLILTVPTSGAFFFELHLAIDQKTTVRASPEAMASKTH